MSGRSGRVRTGRLHREHAQKVGPIALRRHVSALQELERGDSECPVAAQDHPADQTEWRRTGAGSVGRANAYQNGPERPP